MLYYILKIIFYIPAKLFIFPMKVIGKKNVPKKGRMLFCANHQTANDPILVALNINRRFYFMGKAPLFKNKFNNWFLRKCGAYPVHHKENDIESVKTTLKHLKAEHALCIFPEGARLKTEEAHDLKNGVVNFAFKTNSPIVPAAFVKKTLAFKRNVLLVGEPFNLSEMEEFKGRKVDKELLTEASAYLKKRIHGLLREYNKKKQDKLKAKQEKIRNKKIIKNCKIALKKLDKGIN